MKNRYNGNGAPRRTAACAVAALAMVLAVAVGGVSTASLLAAQPETLTVGAVMPQTTTGTPGTKKSEKPSRKPAAAPEQETEHTSTVETAEQTAQSENKTASGGTTTTPEQTVTETEAPAQPETPAKELTQPEAPAADNGALDEENSVPMLLDETPELAAEDPEAPAAEDSTPENDTSDQHTPEGGMLLTPEEIQEALDSGALEDAEAQCIDLSDENGFLRWLFNWIFGIKDDDDSDSTPAAPVYSGWRTENGKTYYYAQSTNKKVTGIQSIDGKLYYFDANGVKQDNVTFGIDVSKYQSNINWDKIKQAGVSFAIIRIGYRGYGASGNLVKDPMFEEHFTNARNSGLKVGVYFFTQAVNEAEAQEEAQACNWALNGRQLDYPIFYDTEASSAKNGTGRADGLGVEDRTKCTIAFCEEVKNLGYKPGVYASTTWYRKRIDYNSLRNRYTIWNAHYGVSSSPIGCDMWQGTEKARISGYSGELDANISYIG